MVTYQLLTNRLQVVQLLSPQVIVLPTLPTSWEQSKELSENSLLTELDFLSRSDLVASCQYRFKKQILKSADSQSTSNHVKTVANV